MGQISDKLLGAIAADKRTLTEIAKAAGVEVSQLSRFRNGVGLNLKTVEALAKLYGFKLQ